MTIHQALRGKGKDGARAGHVRGLRALTCSISASNPACSAAPGSFRNPCPVEPTRAPTASVAPPAATRIQPISVNPSAVPSYGELDEPSKPEDPGPPNGLTLDAAIHLLLQRNLSLIALRYEIPMAEADVLTASLRNNPIFYGDGQLVPYGHYSNAQPGGQTQYDVNVTFPLDVWRKRRAGCWFMRMRKKSHRHNFKMP